MDTLDRDLRIVRILLGVNTIIVCTQQLAVNFDMKSRISKSSGTSKDSLILQVWLVFSSSEKADSWTMEKIFDCKR